MIIDLQGFYNHNTGYTNKNVFKEQEYLEQLEKPMDSKNIKDTFVILIRRKVIIK